MPELSATTEPRRGWHHAIRAHGLAALLLALACDPATPQPGPAEAGAGATGSRRALVVAVDGLEWSLIQPLLDTGRMPELARLIREGASGELHSLEGEGEHSATLWTSIATGRSPQFHGIPHVLRFPEDAYEKRRYTGRDRRVEALWNVASALGSGANSIFYWMTWPPDEIDGIVVSDQALRGALARRTHPTDWTERVAPYATRLRAPLSLTTEPIVRELIEPGGLSDRELARLVAPHGRWFRTVRKDVAALELAEQALAARPGVTLTLVYFQAADHLQHFLWRYMEPEGFDVAPEAARAFGSAISRYLEVLDGFIGRLRAAVGEDATLAVVSDHGFRKRILSYEAHADPLLEALGLARRSGGRLVPSETLVFDVETRSTLARRRLRLNVRGRSPEGVIEADAVATERERIRTRLAALRTVDDVPVFRRIEAATDDSGADLIVEFDDVAALARTSIAIDGSELRGADLFPLQPRSGAHRPYGVIVLHGADVGRGARIAGAELVDFAPTLLHLLGLPISDAMEGRVLEQVFRPGLLAERPPRRVESLAWTHRPPAAESVPASVREADLERLRSLGYAR